jgi:ATP-dependent Clp protease protease subunit
MPVDIFSKLLDDRIIFLSDEVDSDICNVIKAQLMYLDMESDEDISIYIDSPGGSVYSGLGLLDVMDYVKCDISTVNTGLAASMAAVILCSGTKGKRKALKRSRTMIHQPLTYGGWMQQASDVEIEAREMNHLKKELYEIISEKTNQNYDRVYKDGDRDYWMSSIDAKKYGMIDDIIIKRK